MHECTCLLVCMCVCGGDVCTYVHVCLALPACVSACVYVVMVVVVWQW